jgi:hypothetical protein
MWHLKLRAGKYSNAALCGRFLLELSREVQSMVSNLIISCGAPAVQ